MSHSMFMAITRRRTVALGALFALLFCGLAHSQSEPGKGGGTGSGGGVKPGGSQPPVGPQLPPGGGPPQPPVSDPSVRECKAYDPTVENVPGCGRSEVAKKPIPIAMPPGQGPAPQEGSESTGTGPGPKCRGGDPVSLGSGALQREERILSVGARGLFVNLLWSYDAQWQVGGDFGWGGDLNFNQRIFVRYANGPLSLPSRIDYFPGTHDQIVFKPKASGVYEASWGHFEKIRAVPGGYAMRQPDGTIYEFTHGGVWEGKDLVYWLSAIRDMHGNAITIVRHTSHRIDRIFDPLGREIEFFYYSGADMLAGLVQVQNLGRLRAIRDFAGRVWQFAYDKDENLEFFYQPQFEVWNGVSPNEVGTPGFVTSEQIPWIRYEYDARHFLTAVYEKEDAGAASLRTEYGTNWNEPHKYGRVLRQTDALGQATHLYYKDLLPGTWAPSQPNLGKTKVLSIDRDGRAIERTLNTFGLTLAQRRFSNRLDPASLSTTQSYESVLSQLVASSEIHFSYDLEGRLLESVGAMGEKDTWTYDTSNANRFAQNNVLTHTQTAGALGDGGLGIGAPPRVTSYQYEPLFQQLRSIADVWGATSTFVYDYQEANVLAPSLQAMSTQWTIPLAALPALDQGDVNGDGLLTGAQGDLLLTQSPPATGVDLSAALPAPTSYPALATKLRYNTMGELIHVIAPNGVVSELLYNQDANSAEYGSVRQLAVHAAGESITSEYRYDLLHRLTQVTDARGVIHRLAYNPYGALTKVEAAVSIDAEKAQPGLSPVGAVTEFFYDISGKLVRTQAQRLVAPGEIREVVAVARFDAMHRLTESEEQVDQDASGAILKRRTRMEYDGEGHLLRVVSPHALAAVPGSVDSFQTQRLFYNGKGELCQVVVGEGSGKESWLSYEYDLAGRLSAIRRAMTTSGATALGCGGYVIGDALASFAYNGFGERTQILGPAGERLLAGVDLGARLSFSLFFGPADGVGSPIALLSSLRSYFDELGRSYRSEVDYFDGYGPLLEDADQDAIVQSFAQFDAQGRLKTAQSDRGGKTQFFYDAFSRLESSLDAAGSLQTLQYDRGGNVVLASSLVSATDGTAGKAFQVAFEYDALNRATKSVDSMGRAQYAVYDFGGRALLTADANGPAGGTSLPGLVPSGFVNLPGNVRANRYNDLGDLLRAESYLTAAGLGDGHMPPLAVSATAITQSLYDTAGRLQKRLDPNGNATEYVYDALGRIEKEIRADGKTKCLEFNANGEVQFLTQEDGTKLEYQYNAQGLLENLLTVATGPNVHALTQNFRYDGLGRMRAAKEFSLDPVLGNLLIETQYRYDSLSQTRSEQTQRTVPGLGLFAHSLGAVESRFDGERNRTQLLVPGELPLSYEHDLAGRLRTIRENGATRASYEYLGSVMLSRRLKTDSKDLDLTAQYDAGWNLTQWNHTSGAQLLLGFGATFDRIGNRTSETHLEMGSVGEAWKLDSLSRMQEFRFHVPNAAQEATNPGSGGVPQELHSFSYDLTGNRTQQSGPSSSESFVPNAINQIQPATGAGFQYDLRGNLVTKGGANPVFTYDALNRVRTITQNGQTARMLRDAAGREQIETRMQGSTLLAASHWQHDGARIVVEQTATTGSPLLTRSFLFGGLGLDELLREKNSQHGALFSLASSLGSTGALVNAQGTILEKYQYPDGFGSPRFLDDAGNTIAQSAYGFDRLFTGARYRPEQKLYDLRNRLYDPQLGRFTQLDPLGSWYDAANHGNGFAYVANNPMNVTDPFGLTGGKSWWENTSTPTGWTVQGALGLWDLASGAVVNLGIGLRETGYAIGDVCTGSSNSALTKLANLCEREDLNFAGTYATGAAEVVWDGAKETAKALAHPESPRAFTAAAGSAALTAIGGVASAAKIVKTAKGVTARAPGLKTKVKLPKEQPALATMANEADAPPKTTAAETPKAPDATTTLATGKKCAESKGEGGVGVATIENTSFDIYYWHGTIKGYSTLAIEIKSQRGSPNLDGFNEPLIRKLLGKPGNAPPAKLDVVVVGECDVNAAMMAGSTVQFQVRMILHEMFGGEMAESSIRSFPPPGWFGNPWLQWVHDIDSV